MGFRIRGMGLHATAIILKSQRLGVSTCADRQTTPGCRLLELAFGTPDEMLPANLAEVQ